MPVAVPLAIVGAGVAGAAISAGAAKSAAQTQAQAANQATNVQQQMFGQTRADLAPFRDFGVSAQSSLGKLLGLDGSSVAPPKVGDINISAWEAANPDVRGYYDKTPEAQSAFPNFDDFAKSIAVQQANIRGPAPTYTQADVENWRSPQEQALEQLPGYQFAKNQGVQTVNRQLGSMGLTGAQAKGIARFVTGLADQTYGEQVGRLQTAANTGENAAAQTGVIGQGYGQGISNTIVGAGTANAAGTVGAANAASTGLSSIPSALIFNKLFSGGGGAGSGGAGIYGSGVGNTDADFGGG